MPYLSPIHLRQLARVLRAGGVIAYPTEGVWGLGCDPFNPAAVRRLLAIKQRPMAKGLILTAASVAQIGPCLRGLTPAQRETVVASWPGPFTWVVPVEPSFPYWLRGDHDGIAVRVSAHPPVRALCEAFGGPIVSTSANLTGRPTARTPLELVSRFGDDLDAVFHAPLGGLQKPSLIRDAVTGAVLRPS